MRRALFVLALSLASWCLVPACGGDARPARTTRTPRVAPRPAPPRDEIPPLMPSLTSIAVDGDALASARRGATCLVLTAGEGGLRARRLDPVQGASGPIELGVAGRPGAVALRAARGGDAGYWLAWARAEAGGHRIEVQALDAAGNASGSPALVAASPGPVRQLELLAGRSGPIVLWEIERGARVELLAATLPSGGDRPISVASDVLGWHALAGEARTLVAVVRGRGGGETGALALLALDERASPSPPVEVAHAAHGDVRLAAIGGEVVIAWTEVTDGEAHVWTATAEATGARVGARRRALVPLGEQALVALVGPVEPGGALGLLAWEAPGTDGDGTRRVHLATIDPTGAAGPERAWIERAGEEEPELAADADGFAALVRARACVGEPCAAGGTPTFVRFGRDLALLASEPVRTPGGGDESGSALAVKELACAGGRCTAVARGAQVLELVELPVRSSPWRPIAGRETAGGEAALRSVSVLAHGGGVVELSAAPVGAGTLVAWLTEGGRGEETGALATQLLDGRGESVAPRGGVAPSRRAARAVWYGGVAAAPGRAPRDPGIVAWIGADRGARRVMVARIGEGGRHLDEQVVLRTESTKSDVALVATQGGHVVSWVDERDGDPELYAASLDGALRRRAPERRLTRAPGGCADVALASTDGVIQAVWSSARPDAGGAGEILAQRFDPVSLEARGEVQRISVSPLHARSPTVSFGAGGGVIAWIEEPVGAGRPGGGMAQLAVLDARGARAGAVVPLTLPRGELPASLALACEGGPCRGVIAADRRGSTTLHAFTFDAASASPPRITRLGDAGGVGRDPSVVLETEGRALLLGDTPPAGGGRLRRIALAW